ncbi:MAG TPA: hypothetical protein VGO67_22280 [Verrucomicrobiae bacterium]|jgi:hypothetical protein
MKTMVEFKEAILGLSNADKNELQHWLDVEQQIHELIDSTIRLSQHHVIWWEIMTPNTAAHFDGVRDEYLDFFEPVCYAFVQGFFVISYQLFDKREDSKHIRLLVNEVLEKDAALGVKLQSKLEKYPGIKKIKTIRHKIFAHRDRVLSPGQILKKCPIVIREMKDIVDFIQDIVSDVIEAAGGGKKADVLRKITDCQDSARNNTFQVLKGLARDLRRGAHDGA